MQKIDIPISGAEPISIGLNLNQKNRHFSAHIFALSENQGPSLNDHLWTTANYISKEVLSGNYVDLVDWRLTCGHRSSTLKFFQVDHKPLRIDFSDMHALEYERNGPQFAKTFNEYIEDIGNQSFGIAGRERRMPDAPASVFTVPCSDPGAKDGVLHCIPSYYDDAHVNEGFDYILADKAKLIDNLQRHDPGMLDHAAHKFHGSTASRWLESTSLGQPRDMGAWGRTSDKRGITMQSGQADLIELVQKLDIPFFPIAVSNGLGRVNIDQVRSAVGYGTTGGHCPPLGLTRQAGSATNYEY